MRTLNDRIEYTLNKIRPYLKQEGGDVEIDHYDKDTGILYIRMVGACNGCYLAPSDISDSIEGLLMNEIPQITAVRLADRKDDGYRSLLEQLHHPRSIKERQKEDK